jgi:hypothetical protein
MFFDVTEKNTAVASQVKRPQPREYRILFSLPTVYQQVLFTRGISRCKFPTQVSTLRYVALDVISAIHTVRSSAKLQ